MRRLLSLAVADARRLGLPEDLLARAEERTFKHLREEVEAVETIAKAGGLWRREYGKSHGTGLADAIIASTAEVEQAELKTLNIKHFPMVRGLRPAYKK